MTDKRRVAAGNLLSSTQVPRAMVDQFTAAADSHLAERLPLALSAGLDAGGEERPVYSAGLKVAHENSWPLVDLRVDWSDTDPVAGLIAIWRAYQPQVDDDTTMMVAPYSSVCLWERHWTVS